MVSLTTSSGNCLSAGRRQAITWNNSDQQSNNLLKKEKKSKENLNQIANIFFVKIDLSVKYRLQNDTQFIRLLIRLRHI